MRFFWRFSSPDPPLTAKRITITAVLSGLCLLFVAVLLLAALREASGTNSYAALAQGWLDGRFDTDKCLDNDCAWFDGRTYIIFPPMPGLIALPFVALFGPGFHFFVPLTLTAFAISGYLWWRIVRAENLSRDLSSLLVLTILFATPLAFVALRGDRVWFYAQNFGFLFATAALYSALVRRSALLAGLFIGMAFLSRQMTILYLPLLYILLLDRETPFWRIDLAAIKRGLTLALFPLIALGIYFAYNYARFGSPMETGYSYIFRPELGPFPPAGDFLVHRIHELGLFSKDYFLFNAFYMFVAGPHVEFTGRYLTEIGSFDINGASLFLVTPALLFALLARWDRSFWFGLGTCGLIMGLTLLYHSNGFSQYSAQRYALDWLPVLLVFLARGLKPGHEEPLSLLTAYAMGVTLTMIAVGGLAAA
jgi:hypothetical protein